MTNNLVQITRIDKFAENEFYSLITYLNQKKLQKFSNSQIDIDNLPCRVAENVITSNNEQIPDCLTCGACCAYLFYLLGRSVSFRDQTQATNYWNITKQTKNGDEIVVDRFLRRDEETLACNALSGEIGNNVSCQIYEQRPISCRNFEAGSDKCHAIRRAFGIEPKLGRETLLEARFRFALHKERQSIDYKIVYSQIVSIDKPITGKDLAIIVLLGNESKEVIHIYNSGEESYLQSEFIGLYVTEALELINLRKQFSN